MITKVSPYREGVIYPILLTLLQLNSIQLQKTLCKIGNAYGLSPSAAEAEQDAATSHASLTSLPATLCSALPQQSRLQALHLPRCC